MHHPAASAPAEACRHPALWGRQAHARRDRETGAGAGRVRESMRAGRETTLRRHETERRAEGGNITRNTDVEVVPHQWWTLEQNNTFNVLYIYRKYRNLRIV